MANDKKPKEVSIETANMYQDLFNHFSIEHDLLLNINEMDEIIRLVNDFNFKKDMQ